MTAVGWLAARRIHLATGVPVGIQQCPKGDSRIEKFLPHVAVRYAYRVNPIGEANLYNAALFPASPFDAAVESIGMVTRLPASPPQNR